MEGIYDRIPSLEEMVALIKEEQGQWGQIAPGLRAAAQAAPMAGIKLFVAAAVEAGLNPNTAAIQYRKQRRFWHLFQIEAGEVSASPEEKVAAIQELNQWRW
jgi:hypothetical protein